MAGDAALAAHVFYDRLQAVLIEADFYAFAEETCKPYYTAKMGAPSLPPGRYFRMHMVGAFEGIDSERRIECAARIHTANGPPPDGRPHWQTNGWTFWKCTDPETGALVLLDHLRQRLRGEAGTGNVPQSNGSE